MQLKPKLKAFADRYPYIGPLFWIVSVQYFITQIVVAAPWAIPYSLSRNTISDLGNTTCGQYGVRVVCSPRHALMNASFAVLGITMVAGAMLIYQKFKKTRVSLLGFSCMASAGFGTLIVGIFPENTVATLHVFGAAVTFVIGNLGIIILGYSLYIPKALRYYTLLSGFIALFATGLLAFDIYLGAGIGGIERLASYPQTLWLIVFGLYVFSQRSRSQLYKS